jgi:hypothetical protein
MFGKLNFNVLLCSPMALKKTEIPADNRDMVMSRLKEEERDLAWLGRKTGIPYGTLYYCLVKKNFKLSAHNLEKINNIINP